MGAVPVTRGTVAVVIPSYNRPRMLAEALRSIDGADQIIVADDGSDFNMADVLYPFQEQGGVGGYLIPMPRRSPAERMITPSCGKLINAALRHVKTDYACVLCDDDLLCPDWLSAAVDALDARPEVHLVRGDWGLFEDETELEPNKLCTFDFPLPLTAGNWVTRMSCATEENCWWDETSLTVHDAPYLLSYIQRHGGLPRRGLPLWYAGLPLLAGYRREHPRTVSHHASYTAYAGSAEALFASERMEG